MARRRASFQPKLRTREHVIADLAVNHVERQGLLCGYSFQEITRDYGFDLLLFTYTALGEMEDGLIYLQVKSTEETRRVHRGRSIPFRIDRAELVTWLRPLTPVMLVVYDVKADAAYWVHVQGYFRTLAGFDLFRVGETVTVHLPVDQVLDPAAMRQFAALRDAVVDPASET